MALYEHVFIVRQDVGTGQVEALTEQFSNIITEHGGKVEKTEYWGLKSMAYKIKKNRKGHYTLLNVDAPAAALHEVERQQRISDDVIRYLTVKVDELEEDPSAMMRSKGRDDRGPRGPRPPFRDDKRDTPAPASEKPAVASEKPAVDSEKPAAASEKPAADSEKPAAASEKPAADSEKPADAPKASEASDSAAETTTDQAKED